jgi:hypothetical protein
MRRLTGHDERSWFDVAEICLNGHVTNSMSQQHPERRTKFCENCGQQVISKCTKCKTSIKGYYHISRVRGHGYSRPAYCTNCGLPYPWTDSSLQAARELSDLLENLTKDEITILKGSLDDLVKDTPKTTMAATRFKKILSKAGKSAADGFRTILIDVLSETAKKIIWS